ncbi:hypothetical protein EDD18DRAFT_1108708 [Armillaria luteobubalina]|uniref:Uncharacterized protein n=1 Tax=Armillaria luteobubalina TaxID=153913 RepID=A0AA39UTX7_9AGAR|nr:hypothetical protein EDD18DRAFT_1108708 [Armillaria luteobubalina]
MPAVGQGVRQCTGVRHPCAWWGSGGEHLSRQIRWLSALMGTVARLWAVKMAGGGLRHAFHSEGVEWGDANGTVGFSDVKNDSDMIFRRWGGLWRRWDIGKGGNRDDGRVVGDDVVGRQNKTHGRVLPLKEWEMHQHGVCRCPGWGGGHRYWAGREVLATGGGSGSIWVLLGATDSSLHRPCIPSRRIIRGAIEGATGWKEGVSGR